MTILFNLEEMRHLKNDQPEWVLVAGDKDKNPEGLGKGWKKQTQNMEEFEKLVSHCQTSNIEFWNYGIVSGLNNINTIDFDWEFVYGLWIQKFEGRTNTATYRTPNLGYRVLVCSSEKDNSNPYKIPLHTEFLNNGYAALGGYAIDAEGKKGQYIIINKLLLTDNTLGADTRKFLTDVLERYDFLQYKCINQTVNNKHIRLDHNQRLALLAFMLSKGFEDKEIHNFFKAVYDSKGRDYQYSITQAQIESGRTFKEKGGKPNPCTPKEREDGKRSVPLNDVFVADQTSVCFKCKRRFAKTKKKDGQKVKGEWANKTKTSNDKEETKADIERRIEYEKNIKFIEQEIGKLEWKYTIDKDHPFRASELANCIMERPEYNIITDKNSEVIYLYVEKIGIYRKDGEQILRTMIDMVLETHSSTQRINETVNLLKIKTYAAITPSKKIAVLNGLLDIQTGKIETFTRYEFVTNKLPEEYIEGAISEDWEKFIDQVCPDDKLLLQEWSGYLLIKGYPFHLIMWLYGPTGRNGKGVWARTMQGLLGPENYSCVSIDEFDGKHRFAVFSLHDSLFNICSEPRTDRALSIEMLQMLSGADDIDAERKNVQERFKFRNPAKLTIMGNKFPHIIKPTDAFWDRLRLCKFPNRFIGTDQIQELENIWLESLIQRAGVLNWMIEGAKRVLAQHGFTMTKTQEETIIQFKRASDSIGAFIAECFEFGAKEITSKKTAYETYKMYCELIGVNPDSIPAFNKRVFETEKIKDTSTRLGGEKKKTKVWRGFKLRPLPEEEKDDSGGPDGNDSDGEDDGLEQQTLDVTQNGTTGTQGTTSGTNSHSQRESTYSKEKQECVQKLVPSVPFVPDDLKGSSEDSGRKRMEASKPTFWVKEVPAGEKCDYCGKGCVVVEVLTPQKETQRRCSYCLEELRKAFSEADWRGGYADMQDYESEGS